MPPFIRLAALAAALAACFVPGVYAQSAGDRTPFLPLTSEPPPKLFVDPPIPERLAAGSVIIPYRTENFRILPVFGPAAVSVSPRAGHLHVTVDNSPWHWADAGDSRTIVVVGLPPGPHQVLIELADPNHKVITGQTVSFTIPARPAHGR